MGASYNVLLFRFVVFGRTGQLDAVRYPTRRFISDSATAVKLSSLAVEPT